MWALVGHFQSHLGALASIEASSLPMLPHIGFKHKSMVRQSKIDFTTRIGEWVDPSG